VASVFVTEPLGGETVVDLHLGDRVVKALAPPTARFAADEAVRIALDPRRLHLFDAAGEALVSAAGERLFEIDVVTV
jgi:multiple sugar transport system ATP-binding protein